ncbi:MAG: response regulator transcription factor [Myxococcales bacterium]|nr:response regulator transcription factor [Myxococcales bacterium]MCB9568506.1 response regulator transcription factor [Myxococcales bacterium]MCB9702008.1 response regulator transcription factor [Myxococcales bacterium]
MDKLRILVAHQRPAIARAIKQILDTYGFAAQAFSDGDAAALAIKSQTFDGVVVDAALPGRPVHELCELAKGAARPVPAVIVIGAIFRRGSYKRRPARLYGADEMVEIHRVATELPALIWRLLARKGAQAAAIAEADMALWSLHNQVSPGPERLAGLVVAGLLLARADEVAEIDAPAGLVGLLSGDLEAARADLAEATGDRAHDEAILRSFQELLTGPG